MPITNQGDQIARKRKETNRRPLTTDDESYGVGIKNCVSTRKRNYTFIWSQSSPQSHVLVLGKRGHERESKRYLTN